MTDWAMQSDAVNSRLLPGRLGAFLKRQGSAKQLALWIDCDERTAFKIRSGEAWPIARHWLKIWLEFGDDVVEAVFYPERVQARLAREAAERETARRQRIAAASLASADRDAFRLAHGLGKSDGPDEEPAELGPPNYELFEDRTI